MKLKMCNCRQCKYCRKHKWNQYIVVHAKRAGRRKVKSLLRSGDYDKLPVAIWIPYTG